MTNAKPSYVIWGSGGTSKKLFDVVTLIGGAVIALFDHDPAARSVLENVPIYHGEEGLQRWCALRAGAACNALVGAESAGGADRLKLRRLFLRYNLTTPTVLHPTAAVSPSARVGPGTAVFTLAIVDAHATVGETCIINDACRVGHDCTVGDGVHVAPGAMILGGAQVGNNALIGANAVVMPGVRVGDNTKVGAGAVVLSDLPPNIVAVGNPARIVKNIR